MTSLFNQSEKTNNLLFIALAGTAFLSYLMFYILHFYTGSLMVYYLQVLPLIVLIFSPAIYALVSQNRKKSLLFSLIIPLFLFMPYHLLFDTLRSLHPFYTVVIHSPPVMDLAFYGRILLQYLIFAAGGLISSVLCLSYQPERNSRKVSILLNYAIPLFLIIYAFYVMFSGFYK
jgi:hypothetical protein